MSIDDQMIHEVWAYLSGRDIKWNHFSLKETGIETPWYGWYYAGDGLYIILDVMTGQLWFVHAKCPIGALAQFKIRIHEVMEAGQ